MFEKLFSRRRRSSRRRSHRQRRILAIAALAICLGAAAYWRLHRDSPDELLSRGLERAAQGDLRGALVDLKAGLAAAPGRAAARFELGKVELRLGDAASALKEFDAARGLGLNSDALAQAAVGAAIAAGRLDRAGADFALYARADQAGWLLLKGELEFAGGRHAEARASLEEAARRDPARTDIARALVRAELALGERAGARRAIDAALATDGKDAETWLLKGQLDLAEERHPAALAAYERALALDPHAARARFGVAAVRIASKEYTAAGKALDELGPAANDDPRVLYARALIANGLNEPQAALAALRKALQVAPRARESLLLAADLHFRLGEYGPAADYARRLLELDSGDPLAQRLQKAIALASGRLEHALGALAGTDPEHLNDPQLLSLLGTTYLKNGQYAAGAKTLARATALAPDSSPIRLQFALTKLATGEVDAAVRELEALRTADPDYLLAEVALVLLELDRQQPEAAQAAITRALAAHPDEPVLLNTRGYVEERSGAVDAARRIYESVAKAAPDFLPARFNLARLDNAAGMPEAAQARYRAILEHHPHQADALNGLAALAMTAGNEAEAERLWQEARDNNPEAVLPRVMLAQQARLHHKLDLAAQFAEEARALGPFLPLVQYEFALAMLATDHADRAVEPLQSLVARFPKSAPLLRLMSSAYGRTRDDARLEATLRALLDLAPGDGEATRALAGIAIDKGDSAAAERLAAGIEKSDAAAAAELRGDVAAAGGHLDAALAAYERAQKTTPSSRVLVKLQHMNDQRATGAELFPEWIAAHPDDLGTRLAAATRWQRLGRNAAAREQYEWIVKAVPRHALALNNLAWLCFEAGDPRAADFARRAVAAAPERAEYLDTYGWLLFKQGNTEQALDLLRKAVERAPGEPDLHYHLAAALADGGQKPAARTELEAALAKPAAFPSRKDAEALLSELGHPPESAE
ncbi:MAG: PEP-CTERM system TPR-repeat protein PrsT [Gammaproteobacteria bacterium]|nr:PEP-CTERM system TPR-repeat protein PrsT [Gammaproteobacteria bacterium]